jgi:hypothetical protein
MNSFLFPQSLLYPAPLAAVPFLSPSAFSPWTSRDVVFTIGRDEPAPVSDQVRAYMNRPRKMLLDAAEPASKTDQEPAGFIVDETLTGEFVFPMKFGKPLADNIIPAPEAEVFPASAAEVAAPAPAPAAASSAARVAAAPKTASKQQPKAALPAQWPTQQATISAVASVVVPQLLDSLFDGCLQAQLQHARRVHKTVSVNLPDEMQCGKAVLYAHRVLDANKRSANKPYSAAIWQQLGEAIEQRTGGCGFDLWVQLFRRGGGVQAEAKFVRASE